MAFSRKRSRHSGSPVIYWWTPLKAARPIAYNGYVFSAPNGGWGDFWTFRYVHTHEMKVSGTR